MRFSTNSLLVGLATILSVASAAPVPSPQNAGGQALRDAIQGAVAGLRGDDAAADNAAADIGNRVGQGLANIIGNIRNNNNNNNDDEDLAALEVEEDLDLVDVDDLAVMDDDELAALDQDQLQALDMEEVVEVLDEDQIAELDLNDDQLEELDEIQQAAADEELALEDEQLEDEEDDNQRGGAVGNILGNLRGAAQNLRQEGGVRGLLGQLVGNNRR